MTRLEYLSLKAELMCRNGSVCRMCKGEYSFNDLTIDHITPKALGGSLYDKENMQLLCHDCHKVKSRYEDSPRWNIFKSLRKRKCKKYG